ncbi:heme transporter IsdDEF, permease component IsdF [Lachnospiraceae bacterium KM106-2]|nr:heme transporter IsdDEF, permease component IsdF [Lachnospiraceae bacterium KM106-2]
MVIACNTGSIKLSPAELFQGLFIEYNETVHTVYDLRFPRIFVAMLSGAALAVSGVLFQAVLKNPLADPSMIGVSSGAGLTAVIISACFPSAYFMMPICALVGGLLSFILVYVLSFKTGKGLSPIRILLVGIAVRAVFDGIISALDSMGGTTSSATSVVDANITMKTWSDVKLLSIYVIIGLVLAFGSYYLCNLLALEDRTARSLGINVNHVRIFVSFIAVLLASIATAVAGVISFVGLIVPHIARLLIGADHKKLIPFSALFGALLLLLADTIGRTICAPYEISASIVMAVLGGPFFIVLLRTNKKI